RGRRQAPKAGRWLVANVDRIDLAVLSPATRAQQTWELVAAELPAPPPTRIEERVYAASDRQLLAVVRDLTAEIDTVALVGHNPGVEECVYTLTGQPVPMPTSALAVITWPGAWSHAGQQPATLRAHGRPPGATTPAR
ncbi:MAG TPA: histidine phosphatase family protein, partial [Lapillicoccus sp.]|nr:histidine phosphatase family protein [Lapillicoccus sp.]